MVKIKEMAMPHSDADDSVSREAVMEMLESLWIKKTDNMTNRMAAELINNTLDIPVVTTDKSFAVDLVMARIIESFGALSLRIIKLGAKGVENRAAMAQALSESVHEYLKEFEGHEREKASDEDEDPPDEDQTDEDEKGG